jgi:hypothetical protein
VLARSLSALPPDERGWITFGEARMLFSTKSAQYVLGESGYCERKWGRLDHKGWGTIM